MRHRHPAFFCRVLELFMAADLSHLVQTIPFQLSDDFPTIHPPLLISISAKYALLHTFSNMDIVDAGAKELLGNVAGAPIGGFPIWTIVSAKTFDNVFIIRSKRTRGGLAKHASLI